MVVEVLENNPYHWKGLFPQRTPSGHKYDYGHAVIFGARTLTGATRLASESCARIGAGLTTVLAKGEAAFIYRSSLPAHVMVEELENNLAINLRDTRRNAVLIGPGAGTAYAQIRETISTACNLDRKVVVDADGLNAVAETGAFNLLTRSCVLTPHEGEFKKLFPDIQGHKLERARKAAEKCGAVIVLKGSGTFIASPDGRAVVNNNAPPHLAIAGTGDVLAGMITGLLAQGMPEFEAACAAVWIHGECARLIGPGLVASDLQFTIPQVLRDLALN
jgi:NAD(P)H-hydrate epimerase